MAVITFDVDAFRVSYPEFAPNPPTDATLEGYFAAASSHINVNDYGCYMLTGGARVLALNLLTAHLAKLFSMINAGETPTMDKSAREDKLQIEVEPPPAKNQFDWWLGLTGYGQQLLALLQGATAGGLYIGVGAPERAGFRKIGGRY